MKVYCPAGITRALGGVEKGDAKHMLAPSVTANRNGVGFTPTCMALCNAMGAKSTAVAVLLMNMVMSDVAKYIPASNMCGPNPPRLLTKVLEMNSDAPVFSSAIDMGIMAAMSTIDSQLMVLYAASTLRKQPVSTINTAAIITAVTGATGMKSNTIMATISAMMAAATVRTTTWLSTSIIHG